MTPSAGHRLRLSIPRRFVCDLLHASRHTPVITFERRMDLGAVAAVRKRLAQPPAWVLLFTKAFAMVAARRPELRRTYLRVPCPHMWQADQNVASVAVERDYHGEPGVFFGFITAPETVPLADMMETLRGWKTEPVDEISAFRRLINFTRLPLPARRFLWWYATVWSGRVKTRNFGTFGISLTGSTGSTALNLIGPLTTALNTGVVGDDGAVDVRLHFDHRVMDGMPAARALAELEDAMRTQIVAELTAMADAQSELPTENPPRAAFNLPNAAARQNWK